MSYCVTGEAAKYEFKTAVWLSEGVWNKLVAVNKGTKWAANPADWERLRVCNILGAVRAALRDGQRVAVIAQAAGDVRLVLRVAPEGWQIELEPS